MSARHIWLFLGLVTVAVASFATHSPATRTSATDPPRELAPPPRDYGYTEANRGDFEGFSHEPDNKVVTTYLGVEWRIRVGVRRLATSGRDVIDFKWSIKYIGRRPPLIIRRPSLTDGFRGDTEARIYAFPPGKQMGRVVTFTPRPDGWSTSLVIFNGPPADWWLEVPKGEAASGTETVIVADIKERLLLLYPNEFSSELPPKMYVEFIHNAQDRGWGSNVDAWTGDLGTQFKIEVPNLKTW